MSAFASHDAYEQFARAVQRERRFLGHEEFLSAVHATAQSRVVTLTKGYPIWRAQVGADEDEYGSSGPFEPHRMMPLTSGAREGRANPAGIPYLYCATDRETALAEVRPWVGQDVSVGRFKVRQDLRLVSCASDPGGNSWLGLVMSPGPDELDFQPPPREEWDVRVWRSLNSAFSRPVTATDTHADYAPTQIIAELFRYRGFDGVVFCSSVGQGRNLVLFDLSVVRLESCHLFRVEKLAHEISECANPYFFREEH